MSNWCICWLFTHIFTVRRINKSFDVKGLIRCHAVFMGKGFQLLIQVAALFESVSSER
jgi:hypothetical protein